MEKALDSTVCRRFMLGGMSWFRRGVSALLRLRLPLLKGTCDRDWSVAAPRMLRPWFSSA